MAQSEQQMVAQGAYKILFIEEVGEYTYKIDKNIVLRQLG